MSKKLIEGKEYNVTSKDLGITDMHVYLNNLLYIQMLKDGKKEKEIRYELKK